MITFAIGLNPDQDLNKDFDTPIIFLKEFLEGDFVNKKNMQNQLHSKQSVNWHFVINI